MRCAGSSVIEHGVGGAVQLTGAASQALPHWLMLGWLLQAAKWCCCSALSCMLSVAVLLAACCAAVLACRLSSSRRRTSWMRSGNCLSSSSQCCASWRMPGRPLWTKGSFPRHRRSHKQCKHSPGCSRAVRQLCQHQCICAVRAWGYSSTARMPCCALLPLFDFLGRGCAHGATGFEASNTAHCECELPPQALVTPLLQYINAQTAIYSYCCSGGPGGGGGIRHARMALASHRGGCRPAVFTSGVVCTFSVCLCQTHSSGLGWSPAAIGGLRDMSVACCDDVPNVAASPASVGRVRELLPDIGLLDAVIGRTLDGWCEGPVELFAGPECLECSWASRGPTLK